MMKEQLYYTIEVRDRKGRVLKHFTRKSHSYVRQWNDLISVNMSETNRSITDTGGTARTVTMNAANLKADAAETVVLYGIRVGTGTTAVTISDYALATAITQGTSAGTMYHYAVSFSAPAVVGSTCSFTITRVIGNQSGATITVKEIGVYVAGALSGGGTSYFLVFRDVLASTVDVPNGGAITVVYTLKVSV